MRQNIQWKLLYILPSLPNRRDESHSLQLWTEFSHATRTIVLGSFGTASAEVIRSHGIFQTLRSCRLRKLKGDNVIQEYVTCFERGESWATLTCFFLVSQGSHTSHSCVDYTGKGDNQAPCTVLKGKCATTNDFFPSVSLSFYFQTVAASVNTSTYLPPDIIYTFFFYIGNRFCSWGFSCCFIGHAYKSLLQCIKSYQSI